MIKNTLIAIYILIILAMSANARAKDKSSELVDFKMSKNIRFDLAKFMDWAPSHKWIQVEMMI